MRSERNEGSMLQQGILVGGQKQDIPVWAHEMWGALKFVN